MASRKEKKMYTVTEAAKVAGRRPVTVRAAIAAKNLQATKVGSVWIIIQDDLDAWIKSLSHYKRGRKPSQ